ncbi:MAG TPA: DinB family protein [Vicinamibacterales bacterium]|nr:DinB family protein [Vicinamibacterales bacterium]
MRFSSLTPIVACVCVLLVNQPASAQMDIRAIVVKHLTTSRDFTLKVADQMPDADYGFKLTPPQMSFAEQMAHLADDQAGLLAPFSTEKPKPSKPASMSKKDVMAFVRQSYDQSIALVSKLTPEQINKSYPVGGSMTGLELLMFVLDHSTHHRASAEMYLRAKGITPAEYEF